MQTLCYFNFNEVKEYSIAILNEGVHPISPLKLVIEK